MTRTTNTLPSRLMAALFSTAFVLTSIVSVAGGCANYVSVTQQPGLVCSGSPVSFTATTDGTGGYFTWESNASNTNAATYQAPGISTRMVIEYTVPSLNCRHLDTFLMNVSPSPEANAGNNGIITGGASTVKIGGKPTGEGGTGTLTYLWSNGSTDANPMVTISSPTSYSVTVTDVHQCSSSSTVNFNYGGYVELMAGLDASSSGRVVSDMAIDNSGILYACGWADKDIYIHNNIQQRALISTPDHSHFIFVAKYDPRSVYPYQWGTKVAAYTPANFTTNYPSYCQGMSTHPFTPNIAQTSADVFVSYNELYATITRVSKTDGSVIYSNIMEGFIITDMKDNGNGELYVSGYCSVPTGSYIGATHFQSGDVFTGSINTTASSLTWTWMINAGLNALYQDGIPSLGIMPASTNALLLCTGNNLNFYNSNSGSLINTNTTTLGYNNFNTRVTVDGNASSPYIYVTDGSKINQFSYSPSLATTYAATTRTSYGPIYDLKMDGSSNLLAITYSDVEKFDSTLNGNLWAPSSTNPYNTCGATSPPFIFSQPDGADRCIAINPSTNDIFVGGSHPDQNCPFSGTYNFPTKFGFIAEVDHSTGNVSRQSAAHTASAIAETTTQNGFSMYPNPVQSNLYVTSGDMTERGDYTVRSLTGQELIKGEISGKGGTNTISTSSLPTGVYLVQIKSAGQVYTEKLVKE